SAASARGRNTSTLTGMSPYRRFAAPVMAPVMALSLVAAGCGGGPARSAPDTWAASVCRALAPWRAEIDGLTPKAQQQMTGVDTPAKARQSLVDLLTGAQAASETARAKV